MVECLLKPSPNTRGNVLGLESTPLWVVRVKVLGTEAERKKGETESYALVVLADSQAEAHRVCIDHVRRHRKTYLKLYTYQKIEINSEEISPSQEHPVVFFCKLRGSHAQK